MKRTPLSDSQISEALETLPGWTYVGSKLRKVFRFGNYRQTVSFALRIAFEAEAINHHPTMVVDYNQIAVTTCTHDAGNSVTPMDVTLALAIEACLAGAQTA